MAQSSGRSAAPNRRPRVVVVAHDRRVRTALLALLRTAQDLQVVGVCDDAESAMSLVGSASIDLALVVVLLPDLGSGLALVRGLAEAGIAVAAMSAQDAHRDATFAAGAAEFLPMDGTSNLIIDGLLSLGGRQWTVAE